MTALQQSVQLCMACQINSGELKINNVFSYLFLFLVVVVFSNMVSNQRNNHIEDFIIQERCHDVLINFNSTFAKAIFTFVKYVMIFCKIKSLKSCFAAFH
jgi:hypothetical protein